MYLKTFEICLEIHQCDIAPFFNAPGLAWQAAIKRTKVKWDYLTYIDVLLRVEKGIRGKLQERLW